MRLKTLGTVAGNFPNRSSTYCAISETHALNSSECTCALERTPALSLHGPGVSGWNGPPGPNFRSANASTAARVVGRAVPVEDAWDPGGGRGRPSLVGVIAEAEPGHLGVAARPEDGVPPHSGEDPPAQPHCLA